jgi:hypothetical protein
MITTKIQPTRLTLESRMTRKCHVRFGGGELEKYHMVTRGFSTLRCGTILAKDICQALGIDPAEHGGLIRKPEASTKP